MSAPSWLQHKSNGSNHLRTRRMAMAAPATLKVPFSPNFGGSALHNVSAILVCVCISHDRTDCIEKLRLLCNLATSPRVERLRLEPNRNSWCTFPAIARVCPTVFVSACARSLGSRGEGQRRDSCECRRGDKTQLGEQWFGPWHPVNDPATLILFSASQVYFDVLDRRSGKVLDNSLIFNIRISDVNDHAPQFPEKEVSLNVKESHAAGVWGGGLSALVHKGFSCFDFEGALDPSCPQGDGLPFVPWRSQVLDCGEMLGGL